MEQIKNLKIENQNDVLLRIKELQNLAKEAVRAGDMNGAKTILLQAKTWLELLDGQTEKSA